MRLKHVNFGALSESSRHALFDQMASVASAAAGVEGQFDDSWLGRAWDSKCKVLEQSCEGYLATSGDRLIGFVAYSYGEVASRPVTHLQAAYVLPEYQGRGVAFAANARAVLRMVARHPLAQMYVAGCVYNPIAFDGWRQRVLPESFYPEVCGLTTPPAELRAVAEELAHIEYGEFRFDGSVGVLRAKSPGRVRAGLQCDSPGVNRHFETHVGAGDSVLFVIEANRSLLLRELTVIASAIPRMFSLRKERTRP